MQSHVFPALALSVVSGVASAQVDDSVTALQAHRNETFNADGEYDWELENTTAVVDSMLSLPPQARQSSAPVFKLAKLYMRTGQYELARAYFAKYRKHPRANDNGRKLAQGWLDAMRRTDSIDAQLPKVKDPRDGRFYRTVKIGTQTWMAENLAWNATGSLCSGNQEKWCRSYGRLYDLATARMACMPGWHLPTEADWNRLLKQQPDPRSLKGPELGGNNSSGFHAMPGGVSSTLLLGGKYQAMASSRTQTGFFWEADTGSAVNCRMAKDVVRPSDSADNDDQSEADDRADALERIPASRTDFLSVRCVQ